MRDKKGFSLLEVVIALVILGMITTTLFAIIRGSVKGAADIERIQSENDQVHRFLELCRLTFQSLPNSATLSLKPIDSNIPEGPQELGIAGMPTAFAFGANPVSYQETIIALGLNALNPSFEDGTPRYNIGISRADIIPATNTEDLGGELTANPENPPDEQGRYWMPLLREVANLHWRFWKESSDEWLDEWSETALPDLIEVQLQMEGRLTPLRLVFALPIKTLREGRGQPQGSTSTTTTTSTSSNPTGQGQQPATTAQPTTPR
ncbi:MAG: prepilin-type N-terminal cleavage/methylation domain-containing protein [Verrucomicrobiaceae bacterium]|nr:prepilin-type N-terminal cleavage/methylation domain-containing protein [Verrucomicrobiaceae bacterium]